jgi:hypothetical protein
MGGRSFTSACQIKPWSNPSSYQCEAMSRNPLGPAQAILESISANVWLGILFNASPNRIRRRSIASWRSLLAR